MLIGINAIAPSALPTVRNAIQQKQADFCEIMVDNFVHLKPSQLREVLEDAPVALHIVASRFLEKPLDQLKQLADYLQPWIEALQPLYVSDHIVRFTNEAGAYLPMITEMHYAEMYEHICERLTLWQSWLGVKLLIENHASINSVGAEQAYYFSRLLQETDTGLLFDASNAYIAQYNHVCALDEWVPLLANTKHFHVGGFRIDEATGIAIDTHDRAIDPAVINYLKQCLQIAKPETLVIEFDAKTFASSWQSEVNYFLRAVS